MNSKTLFNSLFATFGTFLTFIFGEWDTPLLVLVSFMVIDYLTGVIAGILSQNLNSNIGFKGILRKSTILLVLIVAVLADRLLNQGTWVFRTVVAYFYIANEALSILENSGKCGIPLPQKLIDTFEQLKKKEEAN